MKRYPERQLETLTIDLARAVGVSKEDAALFAKALLDADLHGTSTHGISRLSIYLKRLERGLIDPKAELRIDRRTGSTLALNAANGIGQVQASKALDMLIPLARQNGIAAASIRNSQHCGALSYYCNCATRQDCILLAMTNAEPAMSPEGGVQAFFGTNPIACSFPTGKGFPIKIDLATSKVARGKIIAASRKNAPIPLGWALAADGQPTTDPHQALVGTILSMAGHKGYALALMVELFSSVLSGAGIGPEVGSMYKDMDRSQNVGHFFFLVHIDAFMDCAEFVKRVDGTIDSLKACRRRPGVEEIFVPGEKSSRTARQNRELGIPVSSETLAELEQWCTRLGIPFLPKPTDCRQACATS